MKKKEFVIGIDGGGTKTAALLSDLQGNTMAEDTGGPSNFQIIGVHEAAKVLFSVVKNCCEKVGCSTRDVKSIVAGLSGAGRESDQTRMRDAFRAHAKEQGASFQRAAIESDARVALEGAFRGSAGIILISGTGSIAFGKGHDGSLLRVGGWGRILGDEGSGFAIGRDGLNVVTRHLDGRIRTTILTKLVGEKLGLSTQEQIISAVYREGFDVSRVAPLVIEAAATHDPESERVLNRAAFELTENARALTFKIEEAARGQPRQKLPLAFIGSILTHETILKKILQHKITFSLPQIKIVEPQAPPAYGAVLMALRNVNQ